MFEVEEHKRRRKKSRNEKKLKKMQRQARGCGGKNKEEIETQRMSHIAVERNRRRLMNDHLCVLRSIMPESYVQKGDQASIVGGAINYVRELEHLLLTLEVKKMSVVKEKKSSDTREEANGRSFLNPRFSSRLSQNNVDVTLVYSHANIRILVPKKRGQLMRIVAGFQALGFTVQHLNVTALEDPMVLYCFSAKLEEGCSLTSADDIAGAVLHVLSLIEG